MHDLIENDEIPMCRLLAITLHAMTMLVVVAFTPIALEQDDVSVSQ